MKKILFGVVAVAIVLSVSAAGVFAAGEPVKEFNLSFLDNEKVCAAAGNACRYVDENRDGICDNRQTSATCVGGQNYVDADGDGICDNRTEAVGKGGYGQNYVDADGDGVCDNRSSSCQGQQRQSRGGNGCRGRNCR